MHEVRQGRWIAKKTARAAVAYGAWASGAMAARARLTAPRVRVLTYHRFGDAGRDPWCVTRSAFQTQMRWAAREGLLISLEDLIEFTGGRRSLPPNAVLVTIDDGYRSVLTEAVPVLRDYRVPALVFVCAGLIGARPLPDAPEPFLSWEELCLVRASGAEVGSHAYEHASLGAMSLEFVREQVVHSRALLAERLGSSVRAFAYPFGTRSDFSPATDRILAEAGYTIAFNGLHGAIRPGMKSGSLPRVKVEGGESLHMFQLTCGGAMDAWRLVDELLWRMQQVRSEIRAAA